MKTLKELKNDLNKINVDRIVRHEITYITQVWEKLKWRVTILMRMVQ